MSRLGDDDALNTHHPVVVRRPLPLDFLGLRALLGAAPYAVLLSAACIILQFRTQHACPSVLDTRETSIECRVVSGSIRVNFNYPLSIPVSNSSNFFLNLSCCQTHSIPNSGQSCHYCIPVALAEPCLSGTGYPQRSYMHKAVSCLGLGSLPCKVQMPLLLAQEMP